MSEAPTPGFVREAQRRVAEAANPADLQARRLRREGWSERSIEDHEKAGGAAAALLYSLIGLEGGVDTPKGQATLYSTRSSGCQVLLTRQKATGAYGDGKKFRPLVEFPPEEITPYRKGSR